ncbi:hypothetical protein ACFVYF_13070 [Streptomyces sp. NPDC058274]|uniref:hypothetical protein n=1 Tax=Streptomyces sp. NPDC058274 TaxID=3346416 RepID=UPI0036E28D8F
MATGPAYDTGAVRSDSKPMTGSAATVSSASTKKTTSSAHTMNPPIRPARQPSAGRLRLA